MDLNLHALTRHFVRLLHLGPISPISISVIAYKIKKSTTNRNGHWTDWTKRSVVEPARRSPRIFCTPSPCALVGPTPNADPLPKIFLLTLRRGEVFTG